VREKGGDPSSVCVHLFTCVLQEKKVGRDESVDFSKVNFSSEVPELSPDFRRQDRNLSQPRPLHSTIDHNLGSRNLGYTGGVPRRAGLGGWDPTGAVLGRVRRDRGARWPRDETATEGALVQVPRPPSAPIVGNLG
jgi:hypothetical protein